MAFGTATPADDVPPVCGEHIRAVQSVRAAGLRCDRCPRGTGRALRHCGNQGEQRAREEQGAYYAFN